MAAENARHETGKDAHMKVTCKCAVTGVERLMKLSPLHAMIANVFGIEVMCLNRKKGRPPALEPTVRPAPKNTVCG